MIAKLRSEISELKNKCREYEKLQVNMEKLE